MQTSAQPFPERVEQAQANPDRMAAIRRAAVRFYDNRLIWIAPSRPEITSSLVILNSA